VASKFDQFRVKGHDCGGAAVRGQKVGRPRQEPGIAVEVALKFKEQSGPAGHEIEQLGERENAISGRLESYCPELCRAQSGETPRAFCQATESIIVMDHRLAIGADLKICFDTKAARNRCCEGGSGILDDATLRVMQTAVGNGSRSQPIE